MNLVSIERARVDYEANANTGQRLVQADRLLSECVDQVVYYQPVDGLSDFSQSRLDVLFRVAQAVLPDFMAEYPGQEQSTLRQVIIDAVRARRDLTVHYELDDAYRPVVSAEDRKRYNRLIVEVQRHRRQYTHSA